MVKKKGANKSGVGRAIIKSKFGGGRQAARVRAQGVEYLKGHHTIDEVQQGPSLVSTIEENDLNAFMDAAIMADRDFAGERGQSVVLNVEAVGTAGRATASLEEIEAVQSKLTVPRRPAWTKEMTKHELQANEREYFVSWRRDIAMMEQAHPAVLFTPFEKNLEVWRQLWRVLERSQVVVQILDGRNPLMYRNKDLERYVKSIDGSKKLVLLINKADLLTVGQRRQWATYFQEAGMDAFFFSANNEQLKLNAKLEREAEARKLAAQGPLIDADLLAGLSAEEDSDEESEDEEGAEERADAKEAEERAAAAAVASAEADAALAKEDRARIYTRDELVATLASLAPPQDLGPGQGNRVVAGFVGYPNVGKSSTVNVVIGEKRVAVGSTPGKTKHFQTILIDDDLLLCDCPGLVFPSVIASKAGMICSGILPIDQMRQHAEAIQLICNRVPRHHLQSVYGVLLPEPTIDEAPDRPPFHHELTGAYAITRGYMTTSGNPDHSRAARRILKDYVDGKILHSVMPPTCPEEELASIVEVEGSMRPADTTMYSESTVVEDDPSREGAEGSLRISDTVMGAQPKAPAHKNQRVLDMERTERVYESQGGINARAGRRKEKRQSRRQAQKFPEPERQPFTRETGKKYAPVPVEQLLRMRKAARAKEAAEAAAGTSGTAE